MVVTRPCAQRGCSELVKAPAVRCKRHQDAYDKARRFDPQRTGRNGVRRDQRLRRVVCQRASWRCEDCRRSHNLDGSPLSFEVHHVDGNPRNNALSNLRCLCPDCHVEAERELRKRRREAVLARRK